MKLDWAVTELEEWLALRNDFYATDVMQPKSRQLLHELQDRQGRVGKILDRVEPGLGQQLITTSGTRRGAYVDENSVRYALGLLRSEEVLNEKLGSPAPKMEADQLHPVVWQAASGLWADNHHTAAVQRAATFVSAHVQSLLDRHDVSDAPLMQQAFSAKEPEMGAARLRWPGDPLDQTVKSMNEGLRGFAPGCFLAIRNPTTHGTDDLPHQVALEYLAALSALMRWIDRCELHPPAGAATA